MWPAQGKRSIGSGMSVSISSFRGIAAETTRALPTAAGPTRAAVASARLASVAERPQVTSPDRRARRRASASSVCTPRFVESSSCHSSTITVSSEAKISWAVSRERRMESVSGVVTSAVGQLSRSRRRSACDVSPVRMPTESPVVRGRRGRSGSSRAAAVSAARARSGVIQTSRSPPAAGVGAVVAAGTASRATAPSQAASVLPVPVGAWSRPLTPASIARQTSSWKSKVAQPRPANQPLNRSMAGAVTFARGRPEVREVVAMDSA